MYNGNWAVIVPMANEERDFDIYIREMISVLNELDSGTVYMVVDNVSVDNTYGLCVELSKNDTRFKTIWAPENKNVVDAYMRGFKEAYIAGHEIIVEMDAGMSHEPKAIPLLLKALDEGYECAFGSRFIDGGSMAESPLKRKVLSRGGTFLSNTLLGSRLFDMTSGYQGFHADVVGKFLDYNFMSTAHFYQVELRYLLRKHRYVEIPIHYSAPSPRVSGSAIRNSLKVLVHYFVRRITGRAVVIN